MNTTSPLAILFAVLIAAGGRRARRPAGAAAHRSVPRAGHAGVRAADGQPRVQGRLDVRLRSASSTRSGCRCSATTSPAAAPTSSSWSSCSLSSACGLLAVRRGPDRPAAHRVARQPGGLLRRSGSTSAWFRVARVQRVGRHRRAGRGAAAPGCTGSPTRPQFQTLQSLPLLLVAVVAGVTTVSGAFVGGILLMLAAGHAGHRPVAVRAWCSWSSAAARSCSARDPNGLVNLFFKAARGPRAAAAAAAAAAPRWSRVAGVPVGRGASPTPTPFPNRRWPVMALLEVTGVTVKFGGITAVDQASLPGRARFDHRPDRPERRRQDHAVQRHHRAAAAHAAAGCGSRAATSPGPAVNRRAKMGMAPHLPAPRGVRLADRPRERAGRPRDPRRRAHLVPLAPRPARSTS